MLHSPFIAMAALVPAALNPSLIMIEGKTLSSLVCGTGVTQEIPLSGPVLPGTAGAACCAKGCHSASEKKKKAKSASIDP
ncbi:MAG: hypothetical protein H6918_10465 [Sphingomonadaceae bacterium]|nr:hypothetical protein [Sphingomonadaceae bacterium]